MHDGQTQRFRVDHSQREQYTSHSAFSLPRCLAEAFPRLLKRLQRSKHNSTIPWDIFCEAR